MGSVGSLIVGQLSQRDMHEKVLHSSTLKAIQKEKEEGLQLIKMLYLTEIYPEKSISRELYHFFKF